MKNFAILLVISAFTGCSAEYGILDFPQEASSLVTEALLLDGAPVRIRIGRTLPITAASVTFRTREVEARLYQDDTLWLKLVSFEEDINGAMPRREMLFGTLDPVVLRPGSKYRLEITAPDLPDLVSSDITYEGRYLENRIDIKNFTNGKDSTECRIEEYQILLTDLPTLDEFYIVSEFSDRGFHDDYLRGRIFSNAVYGFDDTTSGEVLSFSLGGGRNLPCFLRNPIEFSNRYVAIYVVDQSYKDFVDAIEQYYEEIAGLFSDRPPIPHNVTGGYGYFGLGTAYTFPITE